MLTNDVWRVWLAEGIDRALEVQGFGLTAFVFMPEHLHLLIFPLHEDYRIDALLKAIKRPFSFKIKKALQAAGSPLLEKLTVRDRPGHLSFRYWQEGGGHDRNLVSTDKLIIAANYIHHNPVWRGLCQSPDRWKWSSWKFYHAPEKYALERLPRIHGFPA